MSTKNTKTAAARRRRRRNMLLLFETPAGYSLFKVKDENKLKDIDVRGLLSLCVSFLSLFLFSRGIRRQLERAINDLIVFIVALLSLSLSRSRLARSGTRMRRSSRLSLYRTSRSTEVSGKETYQRARAKARLVGISICAKADATFILVFFSSLGLCFYTQNTYYRRWRNRSAPRIPPRKWSR